MGEEKKKKQAGQAIEMFSKSQSRSCIKQPTVVASLIFITCLDVEIIQHWFYSSADLLWPYIKVKVIKSSMNIYAMNVYCHTKFECHS